MKTVVNNIEEWYESQYVYKLSEYLINYVSGKYEFPVCIIIRPDGYITHQGVTYTRSLETLKRDYADNFKIPIYVAMDPDSYPEYFV